MNMSPEKADTSLRQMLDGYRTTQSIYVAVKLGIVDFLAIDPHTSEELAEKTSAHPPSLYRLLRALAAMEVLHEEVDGRFSLAPRGEELRSDHPNSLAGWAAFVGEEHHWRAWGSLLHSVSTGETAFDHVFGTDPWTYRSQYPEASAAFDRGMTSRSKQVTASVLSVNDFGRFSTLVDVGGSNGALLAAILVKYPDMHGILFDLPHVVAGAPSLLEEAGVRNRCEIVAGSFFEAVPSGGDAYVLKSIIHDWNDERSIEILRICREAMSEGTSILLVEQDLGRANETPAAKLSDLNMMVMTSGQERTTEEYAALLATSGFHFTTATSSPSGTSVFEGIAV